MPRSSFGSVAESDLHRSMKSMVRSELELDSYRVLEEPPYPPLRRMSWTAYRPDLLGFRSDMRTEEIAIVECETHPSMTRFLSKNYSSLWFEPSIFHEGSIRRILAVPRGKLHAVDMKLRKQWEIWVLGSKGPLEKISSMTC
ncbi:MAG: hypothetical protein OK474_07715 [Thaumarchaeota archaeon]|nr:hypothetical protein [Nitrososphaerota archaeon]